MYGSFEHRELLHLLWLVPGLALIVWLGFARKDRALRRFASSHLIGQLMPAVSRSRQWAKAVLVLLAVGSLAVAAAGPRWGERWTTLPRRGIDLMVALDVSKSMLAEDIAPNRLERAKDELKDLLNILPGDRIGLITFAGAPSLTCPLTINYGAYRLALDEVDVRSAPRGGTAIGDAVRLAAESFVDRIKEHKAILVITDGEDHESYPVEAAAKAWEEHGVRVFTVGFGDPTEGARIPLSSEDDGRRYLQHKNQQVWTKMDPSTLQEMAVVGGGAYFGVGTRDVDFREVYKTITSKVRERELEVSQKQVLIPRFHWFAGLALLFLMLDVLLTERKSDAAGQISGGGAVWRRSPKRGRAAAMLGCGVVLLGLVGPARAAEEDARATAAAGVKLLEAGDHEAALRRFREAEVMLPESAELAYNRGVAHYRLGQLEEARDAFLRALSTRDLPLEARAKFNLGNCAYADALERMSNLSEAIERLQTAIAHYRDSLEINPKDDDARANIERAQLLIKDLLDKQKQEQEEQKQENQEDRSCDDPGGSESQDLEQQQDQSGEENKEPQAQSQQKKAEQQSGEGSRNNSEQEKQEGDQEQPQGELEPLEQGEQQDSGEDRNAADEVVEIELTEEEAERLLQAVRDKERERREKLRRRRAIGRPSVERDW